MRHVATVVIVLAAAASCVSTTSPRVKVPPTPSLSATTRAAPPVRLRFDYPAAKRTNDADAMHGITVPDPYRWLEADDAADVKQWFEQEDARARRELGKLESTKTLVDQMNALFKDPLTPLPTRRMDLAFIREDNTIVVRDDKGRVPARTVFEGSALPSGVRMTSFVPSMDGALMAVETSRNGADMRSVRVVDVKTGRELEALQGFEGSKIVWTKGGFFYAFTPPEVPHADRWASRDVRFHVIGKPQSRDRIVVPASGDKNASSGMNPIAVTSDGTRLLVRTFGNWMKQTFAVVELTKPSAAALAIDGADDAVVIDDVVFAVTKSSESSQEIRRLKARSTQWELVGRAGSQLLSMEAFGTTLVLTHGAITADTSGGFVRRELYDRTFQKLGETNTPRGATDIYYSYPNSSVLIVTREGLGIPPYRFELDPRTGAARVFAPSKVAWDSSAYVTEALAATSRDGTKVPITVLRRKDTPLNGTGSLLVYGYGGFKVSAEQLFYPPWMVWAAQPKGVFASCHTRGGMELGAPWHLGGARRNRQNTVDDLHACLEELERRGYATPARTLTQGWSHGGMLVAAAAMQRPDLQSAVMSTAPLADMVRFPIFGRGGVSEYGDPEDADDFKVLLSISPYHRVREGVAYPAFFVSAPSKDERVHPMHPRKLVAALQQASTGGEVLLKVMWEAGHLGGGKDDANQLIVEGMAFALSRFGGH